MRRDANPVTCSLALLAVLLVFSGTVQAGRIAVTWELDKREPPVDSLMSFGAWIASAGDVDADGYDDIVVGNPAVDMGPDATFTGRAYVYLGGRNIDTIPDIILVGETKFDVFGSVAGAGDVNSDGYDDVLVGAQGAVTDTSGSGVLIRAGKTYVYFGGPNMDSIPDLIIEGQRDGCSFGRSVSAAGDVNSDGHDDFVVGADQMLVYQQDCVGRAYVYYGGPTLDIYPDLVLTGPGPPKYPSNFGHTVAAVGDVNGDGYSDIMVGAPCHTEPHLWQGKVYVYFGGSPPDTMADVEMLGEGPGHFLGMSGVSGAGDVNGDGYDDALTGTDLYPGGFLPPEPGKLYILFGGSAMDSVPDWTKVGSDYDSGLGYSFSGVGDVDGDGCDDIVAGGANEHSVEGPDGYRSYGRACFFLGGCPMAINDNCFLRGSYEDCYMGSRTVKAGDVDGDSIGEFIIASGYHPWAMFCRIRLCKWVETALVTDLTARGGDGLVRLDWSAEYENDTRGYEVCRSESSDTTDWVRIGDELVAGAGSYSYADTMVVNENTYYYWIEVLGKRGSTDVFGPVSATPDTLVVSSLSAAKGAARYVVVHWESDNEPELLGWNIYRREERDSLPGENEKVNGEPIPQGGPAYEWSDCWGVQEGKVYFYWLSAVDLLGRERFFGPVEVVTSMVHLFQNTPNPFDSGTSIRYMVNFPCRVTLRIYDISGRRVRSLVDEFRERGTYTCTWDGGNDMGGQAAPGVYFYRLTVNPEQARGAGNCSTTRKMIFLR